MTEQKIHLPVEDIMRYHVERISELKTKMLEDNINSTEITEDNSKIKFNHKANKETLRAYRADYPELTKYRNKIKIKNHYSPADIKDMTKGFSKYYIVEVED